MERYHFLLIKLEVFSVLNANSLCWRDVMRASPLPPLPENGGLAQPLLLQTTGTAHLTGVGPAAQRSQSKQVLSWMQCVCVLSPRRHTLQRMCNVSPSPPSKGLYKDHLLYFFKVTEKSSSGKEGVHLLLCATDNYGP